MFHRGLESEKCLLIYSQVQGTSASEVAFKHQLYGNNSIEIELLPIWRLIIDEVVDHIRDRITTTTNTSASLTKARVERHDDHLHFQITGPFYLYQFFICSIWLIQFYYQFAVCILILSILSVGLPLLATADSNPSSVVGGHPRLADQKGKVNLQHSDDDPSTWIAFPSKRSLFAKRSSRRRL